MKSSRKHFRFGLGKLVFMLIVMAVSLLFLVQCKGAEVEDLFQEDIKEHFGDMNYAEIAFAKNISSRDKAGIDYQRGSGVFEDRNGKKMSYKWAYLIDENGDLLAGYIGTSSMASTTAVELTRDEAKDALRRCAQKDDVKERFACFDRVVEKIFSDCQFSLSLSDCKEQCWLDPSQCKAIRP